MGGDWSKSSEPKPVQQPTQRFSKVRYANKTVSVSSSESSISPFTSSDDNVKDVKNIGDILYVLALKDDCYYVGVTSNLDERLKAHRNGKGAEWTKLHPFDKLLYSKPCTHPLDEDKEVRICMMKYGIDNVRGGSISYVKISPYEKSKIQKEITHAEGKCFHCQGKGHYVKQCPKKTDKPSLLCVRCGRNTHSKDKCFAKSCLDGATIERITYCRYCGKKDHSKGEYANAKCEINKTAKYCVYCGKTSHSHKQCPA